MIRFQGVCKSFAGTEVVHALDLQVAPGELFGFLGPNGAGKTTTIRMATGMLCPSSGSISIAGYDVHRDGAKVRRRIGHVPDQPYLYDKLTGREFLEFSSALYGVEPSAAEQRADALLEMFDLTAHADQLCESYSHGMRQKLVIASVLLHRPEVIFLDEPTTALDPKSARLVKDHLRSLCDHGTTVFMSTHVLEIAERMCDRIAIIDQGRIVALGTCDELSRSDGHTSLEEAFLAITADPSEDA